MDYTWGMVTWIDRRKRRDDDILLTARLIFWSALDCQLFCVLNTWPPYLIIRSHHDHRQQQQQARIRRATILIFLANRTKKKDYTYAI